VIVLCTAFAVLGLEFLPDWNAPAFTRFNLNLVDQSSVLEFLPDWNAPAFTRFNLNLVDQSSVLEGFVAKKSVSQGVITSDLSCSDDCCRSRSRNTAPGADSHQTVPSPILPAPARSLWTGFDFALSVMSDLLCCIRALIHRRTIILC